MRGKGSDGRSELGIEDEDPHVGLELEVVARAVRAIALGLAACVADIDAVDNFVSEFASLRVDGKAERLRVREAYLRGAPSGNLFAAPPGAVLDGLRC